MNDIPLKRCTGPCGQEYPATEVYFYRYETAKDGLNCQCKRCIKEKTKERQNRPEVKARTYAYKHSQKALEYNQSYRARPEVKERQKKYDRSPESKERKQARREAYMSKPALQLKSCSAKTPGPVWPGVVVSSSNCRYTTHAILR